MNGSGSPKDSDPDELYRAYQNTRDNGSEAMENCIARLKKLATTQTPYETIDEVDAIYRQYQTQRCGSNEPAIQAVLVLCRKRMVQMQQQPETAQAHLPRFSPMHQLLDMFRSRWRVALPIAATALLVATLAPLVMKPDVPHAPSQAFFAQTALDPLNDSPGALIQYVSGPSVPDFAFSSGTTRNAKRLEAGRRFTRVILFSQAGDDARFEQELGALNRALTDQPPPQGAGNRSESFARLVGTLSRLPHSDQALVRLGQWLETVELTIQLARDTGVTDPLPPLFSYSDTLSHDLNPMMLDPGVHEALAKLSAAGRSGNFTPQALRSMLDLVKRVILLVE